VFIEGGASRGRESALHVEVDRVFVAAHHEVLDMEKPPLGDQATLAAIVASARAAWPGVGIADETYIAYLAARVDHGHSLESLRTDDLFLACACVEQDLVALGLFEEHYIGRVRALVGHLRLPPADLDELEQSLRADLLVADDGPPTLARYAGRGELLGWLRVTAVRAGLRQRARAHKSESLDEDEQLASATDTPELAFLKAADVAAFREAFRVALASLEPVQQNVLRQHYIDGLSIDELGALHGAHRTTTARWLREAREALLKRTKKTLMKGGASSSQCESIVRQAGSRLELSLRSLLR
jgi:RNA polymerase sigma-70 factor (ECF subfamily)